MWNPQCLTSDYASNDDFEGEREIKFKYFLILLILNGPRIF